MLSSHFPDIVDKLKWILIDDKAEASIFGDPEKYPLNGYALTPWKAIRILPRGMGEMPHRIATTSNFEGTLTHESTHLIQQLFQPDWDKQFKWDFCFNHEDEWELRRTPDGKSKKWFNKQTDEMSPQGQFALQPDQCINYYSKQNSGEDICDSVVAYIYDPDRLQDVSSEKYKIIQSHDAKQLLPNVTSKRIPKEEIRLPEIKAEVIYYYIEEPKSEASTKPSFVIKDRRLSQVD